MNHDEAGWHSPLRWWQGEQLVWVPRWPLTETDLQDVSHATKVQAAGDLLSHGHLRAMSRKRPARSVLARHADRMGVEMDQYELGVALAVGRIVELRRQADWWRLASRLPGRTRGRHRDRVPGSWRLPDRPTRSLTVRAAAPPRRPRPAAPDQQPWRQPC